MYERLPSLPNLPSAQNEYEVGGNGPDIARPELDVNKLESASRPTEIQGEIKTDADGVKANKYKIEYNGDTKRIQGRIEKNGGTRRKDSKIENGRGTRQEDLKAGEFPVPSLTLSRTRTFGFQYQTSPFGRIGLEIGVDKSNKEIQE